MVSTTEYAEVTLASLLEDYTVYNCWANTQLVEWLRTKPVESMETHVPSSFSSLKTTLLHIWQTQDWWFANLRGLHPGNGFERVFTGTVEDIFRGIVRQSAEMTEYVRQLPASALQRYHNFAIPYVGDFSRPGFEMIQHCMNHSTYHRGQLVTIGRNLGFTDAPMTDYMFYLLMVKHQPAAVYGEAA